MTSGRPPTKKSSQDLGVRCQPRVKPHALVLLTALVACEGTEIRRPSAPSTPARIPDPGPIVPATVSPISMFEQRTFAVEARSPVVAVTPDGVVHHAAIDAALMWPTITRDGAEPVALPGARAPSMSLALVASADGALHATWDAGGAILYATIDPVTYAGAAQVIATEGYEPTLAIAPDGTIALAFTAEAPAAEDGKLPPRIMVATGSVDGSQVVFGAAEHVNPACCESPNGGEIEKMSGASVAVAPDGTIHVTYEWSAWDSTTIEHVMGGAAGWSTVLVIDQVAFSPCPSITADETGAHIVFLREGNSDVWYVHVSNDGVASATRSLYRSESFIRMAMLLQDAAGRQHIAITSTTRGQFQLEYLLAGTEVAEPILVTHVDRPAFLDLTPRAGGAIVSPSGRIHYAYRISEDQRAFGGAAMVAVGR